MPPPSLQLPPPPAASDTCDAAAAVYPLSGPGGIPAVVPRDHRWQLADRLRRFYQRYKPQLLQTVGTTLREYQGMESALLASLVRTHGPEPRPEDERRPPAGWELRRVRSGALCWFEIATGMSSWEVPVAAPAADTASRRMSPQRRPAPAAQPPPALHSFSPAPADPLMRVRPSEDLGPPRDGVETGTLLRNLKHAQLAKLEAAVAALEDISPAPV
eukprot:TRINITY_DN32750_c0_g1_i1.p3 TRINITY_DN32750_c0_g1~~TRINITY_DN32750_c0_g1_i1.p3  ORF type:complete len:235 (+),score=68.31 TRINITY_DN32750_c0_g1_i1:58-705(+)